MTWTVRALGSAEGEVLLPEGRAEIRPGTELQLGTPPLGMICRKGKLGDSEDSFLFLCAGVDPRKENFRLSARLTAAAAPGLRRRTIAKRRPAERAASLRCVIVRNDCA